MYNTMSASPLYDARCQVNLETNYPCQESGYVYITREAKFRILQVRGGGRLMWLRGRTYNVQAGSKLHSLCLSTNIAHRLVVKVAKAEVEVKAKGIQREL